MNVVDRTIEIVLYAVDDDDTLGPIFQEWPEHPPQATSPSELTRAINVLYAKNDRRWMRLTKADQRPFLSAPTKDHLLYRLYEIMTATLRTFTDCNVDFVNSRGEILATFPLLTALDFVINGTYWNEEADWSGTTNFNVSRL